VWISKRRELDHSVEEREVYAVSLDVWLLGGMRTVEAVGRLVLDVSRLTVLGDNAV
jgi:hypothetical protein